MNDDIQVNKPNLTGLNQGLEQKSQASQSSVPASWIKVINGEFTCKECDNTSVPETNTIEGTVDADIQKIKEELIEFPTKVTYATCPFCGMEYVFRISDNEIYLEPGDEEK
jgi:transcription elongation factor Elf1